MNTVQFVVGGPSTVRSGWTVAVVSEGYTQAELNAGVFDIDAVTFVIELLSTVPFSDRGLRPLINVVQVSVPSTNTGNKIKLLRPAPDHSEFGTMFGALFGRDIYENPVTGAKEQIERSLWGDGKAVQDFVRARPGLDGVNNFLVIVNNTELDGGSAHEGVGWTTKRDRDWAQVAVHELGHQAFVLEDEYQYDHHELTDPPRRHSSTEPTQRNVTTRTDVRTMKWADDLTLAQTQVPSTVVTAPCTRDHRVRQDGPPIPAGAVGAFEGAAHYDCGIYRPSLTCKMRHHRDPFCRVCERIVRVDLGHLMVTQGGGATAPAGEWTHVQNFMVGPRARLLSYHMTTGAYAISRPERYYLDPARRPDGTPALDPAHPAAGTGTIGSGWTWLVPFESNGSLNYLAYQSGSGRTALFRTSAARDALAPAWEGPPGGPFHSHVVTTLLDGAPHFVGYDTFTGEASLYRIDDPAAEPVFVRTMQWGAGHTAVVTVPADGDAYVVTYRLQSGEVMIRRLTPAGFTMAFASPSRFWQTNVTHLALLDCGGRPYLVRYSDLVKAGSVVHMRTGGSGLDFVCNLTFPPEAAALSLFGVGAPALGRTRIPEPGDLLGDDFFFYDAEHRTLRVDPLTVH
ncbi:M64 family metallopeptidase [Streptomyces sp. NRRL S-87]|uniref:M64 family metallopeptidase n=1 Tax=Streptomyces sp. NRRL S-87 TaxID=1463920 RepID=UPI0004C1E872|nr:M64 family metallopeptidase [Streptomyces sp. NRRL S-87]